jgi:hypothetical protein
MCAKASTRVHGRQATEVGGKDPVSVLMRWLTALDDFRNWLVREAA